MKREASAGVFPVWEGYPRQIISVLLGMCQSPTPVRLANKPITGRSAIAHTTATANSMSETMVAQARERSQTTRPNQPRCAVTGFVGDVDYCDV